MNGNSNPCIHLRTVASVVSFFQLCRKRRNLPALTSSDDVCATGGEFGFCDKIGTDCVSLARSTTTSLDGGLTVCGELHVVAGA